MRRSALLAAVAALGLSAGPAAAESISFQTKFFNSYDLTNLVEVGAGVVTVTSAGIIDDDVYDYRDLAPTFEFEVSGHSFTKAAVDPTFFLSDPNDVRITIETLGSTRFLYFTDDGTTGQSLAIRDDEERVRLDFFGTTGPAGFGSYSLTDPSTGEPVAGGLYLAFAPVGVPEPGTMALVGLGAVGVGAGRLRRRHA